MPARSESRRADYSKIRDSCLPQRKALRTQFIGLGLQSPRPIAELQALRDGLVPAVRIGAERELSSTIDEDISVQQTDLDMLGQANVALSPRVSRVEPGRQDILVVCNQLGEFQRVLDANAAVAQLALAPGEGARTRCVMQVDGVAVVHVELHLAAGYPVAIARAGYPWAR